MLRSPRSLISWIPNARSGRTARTKRIASSVFSHEARKGTSSVWISLEHVQGVTAVVERLIDDVTQVRAVRLSREHDGVPAAHGADPEAGDLQHLVRSQPMDLEITEPRVRRRMDGMPSPVTRGRSMWSACSSVTRIASAPTSASASLPTPGSMTTRRPPSPSSRRQECVYLMMRIQGGLRRASGCSHAARERLLEKREDRRRRRFP